MNDTTMTVIVVLTLGILSALVLHGQQKAKSDFPMQTVEKVKRYDGLKTSGIYSLTVDGVDCIYIKNHTEGTAVSCNWEKKNNEKRN